jgi:AraC-like DNA-binding protein
MQVARMPARTGMAAGFSDQSHLARQFDVFRGVTPGECPLQHQRGARQRNCSHRK